MWYKLQEVISAAIISGRFIKLIIVFPAATYIQLEHRLPSATTGETQIRRSPYPAFSPQPAPLQL